MKSKVLTVLLSIAIAFGLWMYVVTVEHTQIEMTFHNVPVVLDGKTVLKDRGLMSASDNLSISMKLYGNRTTLNKLKSSDIIVTVDLTQIHEAGTKKMSYDAHVPGDIEIVSRPDSIEVVVVEWDTKEIAIQPTYTGTPAQNYFVDEENITCQPETATISGPKAVLDKIAVGKALVDMEGKKESFEGRVRLTLCGADGEPVQDVSSVVVETASQVLVKVPVLMEREIGIKVDLTYGGGLTEQNTKVEIQDANGNQITRITVRGTPALVAKLADPFVLEEIDLNKISQSFEQMYSIPLPEGVKCVMEGWVVEDLTVKVTIPELDTRQIYISENKIEAAGLDMSRYSPDYTWPTIGKFIKFRGEKAAIASLTADDITVRVDFDGSTESKNYPLIITVKKSGVAVAEEDMEVFVTVSPVTAG